MKISLILAALLLSLSVPMQGEEAPRQLAVSSEAKLEAPVALAALPEGRLLCLWLSPEDELKRAYFAEKEQTWFGSMPTGIRGVSDMALVHTQDKGTLLLFTVESGIQDGSTVFLRRSQTEGAVWDAPMSIHESPGRLTLGSAALTAAGGVALGCQEQVTGRPGTAMILLGTQGASFEVQEIGEGTAPELLANGTGALSALFFRETLEHRPFETRSIDGRSWSAPQLVNLPVAASTCAVDRIVLSDDGLRMAAVQADIVNAPDTLRVLFSWDGGRTWPVRRKLLGEVHAADIRLARSDTGTLHAVVSDHGAVLHLAFSEDWALALSRLEDPPAVSNVTPPLTLALHPRNRKPPQLPLADAPQIEHVRVESAAFPGTPASEETTLLQGGREWKLRNRNLSFRAAGGQTDFQSQPAKGRGEDGPLSPEVNAIAVDGKDTLWAATSVGLSARDTGGTWRHIRGRDGLPWEELNALAVDGDDLWIGSTRGLILYRPYDSGRQWFYRAGQRYLPNDDVLDIVTAADKVHVLTPSGPGAIAKIPRTLYEKAEYLESRLLERHLRLGMPSPADYDDAIAMRKWEHGPQPSDGLWTSYHVAAMSMAWSLTLDPRYKAAAKEGMEALYLLQNVTGIPGLVARTMVSVDEPAAAKVRGEANWHPTADGKYLWRDDVSSDQIDGHYFAFYTYFEHIAQFDPAERTRLEKQIRQVTDYILAHDYQIPDWDGERTLWGWWDPVSLNTKPMHYLESGIYSLMILSFLKTTHYVTDDAQYLDHFNTLIREHGYLSNLQLEKKLFPDELNHSDDQLSAIAYYPFLQLEQDPFIRDILHRSARRHAFVEVPERNSLFAFVYASVAPEDADVEGGVQTLREMPQDRRNWRMENSHRADVSISRQRERGGDAVLHNTLPADERNFERWNQDPYEADGGGDGRNEGSGEHYILPYWMGRYHGLIAAPDAS